MRNNRGRRFDAEPKLNIKKVIATILAIIVLVMVIASIIMIIRKKSNQQVVNDGVTKYFSAYIDSKWSVINSKGEQLTDIVYDEMLIIPDEAKNIFIATYDVDYTNGTFKTKAINEKNEQLFSQYNNVAAVVNYKSLDDVWYDNEVLTFEKDGKYGLIDFAGKQVLPPEYENITALQGITKTVVIKKDGKYGLFNSVSKTKFLDENYISIEAFGDTYNEGYITTDVNGKIGLVGSEGKVILENKYDGIDKVSGSDMYVVLEGGRKELISKDGTVILNAGFEEITSIDGEYLLIKNIGKYGVIDKSGTVIIDAAFDSMKSCFSGHYIVSTAGKYGVIDLAKNIKVEVKYNNIEYRSDIASLVCENDDFTTDVYTRDLKLVFTGTISQANADKGYIRARVGDEYKYYNLQYQEISNRDALKGNTLFLVKENGKEGYVNSNNEKVVECIYDDAREQNEFGFAAVNKDGKWGALQSNGAVLLEPSVVLDNSINIDFIGTWHLNENVELNTYTK